VGKPKASEAPKNDAAAQAETLSELRAFYLYGPSGPSRLVHASEKWPTPALLDRYRDLHKIRHDYPLCLAPGDGESPARPLAGIVDEVVTAAADESDEGRRLERRIYQLEAAVKRLLDKVPGAKLSVLWRRAAEEIAGAPGLARGDREMLKQDMNVALGALTTDGELLPCAPNAAERLFSASLEADWRDRSAAWRGDIDRLIEGLKAILAADFSRSPEAKSPEHLEAAVGAKDSVDFEAMSTILRSSDLGKPIPEARRKRIESALEILDEFRPIYRGDGDGRQREPAVSLGAEISERGCAGARDAFDARLRAFAVFFKAVRIAQLETSNRYHENVHDPFFERFGPAHLTADEIDLCPPLAVVLDSAFLSGPEKSELIDLLGSGLPVKILAAVDDLIDPRSASGGMSISYGWGARVAAAAAALGEVYVVQAPISDPRSIQRAMRAGLRHRGSALFVVYSANREHQPGLSTFHAAAASTESRTLPAFIYDPGRSNTLAGRTDVSLNPRPEAPWSVESFEFVTPSGEEASEELAFTPADFLLCDVRFSRHFWRVPPSFWHPDMISAAEFLGLDENAAAAKVPFLTAVTPDGEVVRVVPTRAVIAFARRSERAWRSLREMGGIENSFAAEALARERAAIDEERSKEIRLARERYDAELGKNVGDLTQEIVRRIVDRIVSGGPDAAFLSAPPADASVRAGASAFPAAALQPGDGGAAVSQARPEPGDEPEVSFDDPYIDTPLCTSCNECTNLNRAMFSYNANKQAYIKDASAGTFRELVAAAEKCPVHIIHPGKPKNAAEPGLEELIERAARFN
jgi:ferredoxin